MVAGLGVSAPEQDRLGKATYSGGRAQRTCTLWEILESTAELFPTADAVDDGSLVLDYAGLRAEVRRAAGELAAAGIGPGDRVGVHMPSGSARLYVSILAILSVGAAYVPVDVDDPDERAELVWSDAGVCAVIGAAGPPQRRATPRGAAPRRPTPDDDAWIIFTSGTTGRPKGVAVTHRSAAAFVDAEAKLFVQDHPLGPGDRVLAGLSVAFDASCEEMWLAWRHGACLVPAPRSLMRTGPELAGWLTQRRISVVSTVPTLASLLPADLLGSIRLLILGGEPCPAALAERLTARCPEVWNTYGPTEGTVVSCAARLTAGEPVRIGLPLEGWQLAVVPQEGAEPVAWGSVGELVIGGVGVARYLDAEQDARRFPPLAVLGWDRAFHSGDLVRAEPEGLVYVGREDSQVKIRGYRIELTEIESALLQVPGVAQAAVTTYEREPGLVELAAYYSVRPDAAPPDRREAVDRLRRRLPAHMVPAYLEQVPVVPLLPSGKADRRNLPPPQGPRCLVSQGDFVVPDTAAETVLAAALADVLGVERVSAESNLFDELGVSSLLVAHFCARVRERGGAAFAPISTRDVYLHPSVRDLAAAVTARGSVAPYPGRPVSLGDSRRRTVRPRRATSRAMVGCGAAQLACLVVSAIVVADAGAAGLGWIAASPRWTDLYLRSLVVGAVTLTSLGTVSIAAKWALIGRWTPRTIPVWSKAYLRFWIVRTLAHASPLAWFVGSPLYLLHLRALGARIGRGVVILSRSQPVCADLLTVGAGTLVRRSSSFPCYRARDGVLETGPVTIGADAFVGEHTVLDIGTSIGDGAQLGHSSALLEGQRVPDGEHWHGSPAQPTTVDYLRVQALPGGPARRILHATLQLLMLVFVTTPVLLCVVGIVLARPELASLEAGGPGQLATSSFYLEGLAISAALYFGPMLVGLVVVLTVPKLLRLGVPPNRTYPLYGVRHGVHRLVTGLTNVKFYLNLFGDSSYVVGYLRALGYRMPDVQQTGSNVGADLRHETPFLVTVGRGTMISDGASLINADYSATSLRLTPLSIDAQNFVGTAVAFPAGARTGADCLIATKAMVPLDGPVRQGVGLLGSPCFEIPRSVTNDTRFDHLKTGEEFHRRLAAKNRHNLVTMGLYLALQWAHLAVETLLAMTLAALVVVGGIPAAVAVLLLMLVFSFAYHIFVERALLRFGRLRPRFCSIYDPYFWWHERYWKLLAPQLNLFNGTPFKPWVWRLVGVRVGRRLFDDGCGIPERTLVTIGDDCTLNAGSIIQCHSMEDGTFKADHTVIGHGCTIGPGALVHYGVTLGDGAELLPDAFVMKGEKVPAGACWGGNPARSL